MDGIRLFAKSEKELENLIQTKRTCSQDIGKEFGIERSVMLIMKSGKREITERIEQHTKKRIRMLRKLQVLGNTVSWDNQTSEDKRKIRKDYHERESFLKPSSAAEISSKGKTPEQFLCKIFFLNRQVRTRGKESWWQCTRPYIWEMT